MKAVVAAFNQEKALVGAFFVIVQPVVEPMEQYTALKINKAYNKTLCVLVIALDKLISQRERKDNPGSCLQRWRGEGTHCTTGIKRVDFGRK